MKTFASEDLHRLAHVEGNCVTMTLPMEKAGSDVQQNRIRFKNAIKSAFAQIDENASPEVFSQLSALEKQESNDNFWQNQSEGLAIFVNAEQSELFSVDQSLPALSVVGAGFDLRPVCEVVQASGRYFVLAASQNQVRLFEGTRSGLSQVEGADLPDDLEDALNIDEYVTSLQHHSVGKDGSGTVYHGHGGSNQDVQKSDELKQYFHRINDALQSFFGQEQLPLVFAGVEYLFPIFKESCDYNALVEDPVPGNPDDITSEQLHEKVWPVVEPLYAQEQEQTLEDYGNAKAQSQAVDDREQVVMLAEQGAIAKLMLERLPHNHVLIDEFDEQLQKAVVHTLRNGGEVFSYNSDQLPAPVVAILRYPLPTSSST